MTKLTDLTELHEDSQMAGASDRLLIIDVSDTTENAAGTTHYTTPNEIMGFVEANATAFEAADVDILKADTADALGAAFTCTIDDDGTQSSGTYTPSVTAGSNIKKIVNGGAFTLGVPALATGEGTSIQVHIVNNASAGAITTSSYDVTSGDSFDTTNTNKFIATIDVHDIGGTEYSHLHVKALQ